MILFNRLKRQKSQMIKFYLPFLELLINAEKQVYVNM